MVASDLTDAERSLMLKAYMHSSSQASLTIHLYLAAHACDAVIGGRSYETHGSNRGSDGERAVGL